MSHSRTSYLVLGGANKCGTTSVFRYLSDHPEVCGSAKKETGYLLTELRGSRSELLAKYDQMFPKCPSSAWLRLDGSTGYLAKPNIVIPNAKRVLNKVKFLFVLRSPIERIWSYYQFQKSELQIPESISFEDYVAMCFAFEDGHIQPCYKVMDGRHFEALRIGRYSSLIECYIEAFGGASVKVMLFDDLRSDPKTFMKEIASFSEIWPDYFDDYGFSSQNVTGQSHIRWLHRLAIFLNKRLEGHLRQRPWIKGRLARIYKALNMSSVRQKTISSKCLERLQEYYHPDLVPLTKCMNRSLPNSWMGDGCSD